MNFYKISEFYSCSVCFFFTFLCRFFFLPLRLSEHLNQNESIHGIEMLKFVFWIFGFRGIWCSEPISSNCFQSVRFHLESGKKEKERERERERGLEIERKKIGFRPPSYKSYLVLQTRATQFQFGRLFVRYDFLLIFVNYVCCRFSLSKIKCWNPLTYSI